MAIVDSDMMMNAPKGLTSASGIDALVHSIEAYVSGNVYTRLLMSINLIAMSIKSASGCS